MSQLFRNKHDKSITAEKSYPYSIVCAILNKDRMVICHVPVDEIENSRSWEEEFEEVEEDIDIVVKPQKAKVFTFTSEQMTKAEAWRLKKNKKIRDGGELPNNTYTYCFTSTGIGTCEVIKCSDGTELDVTDVDNW